MFLRGKATSWSSILLRDEILHAGIRPVRTPLKVSSRRDEHSDGDEPAALAPLSSDGSNGVSIITC